MHVRDTIDDLIQDLRYTSRTLRRDAGFTALAMVIIGLGIGASATVFSVANTLLLRPLPFKHANELIWVGNKPAKGELAEWSTQEGHYVDIAAQNKSLSEIAAFSAFFGVGDRKIGVDGDAVRVSRVQVTPSFFPVARSRTELGRSFSAEESAENPPPVVMLSHSIWAARFGSDRNIVGKSVIVDGVAMTVVGVLPASFDFGSVFSPGSHIDLFTAYPLTAQSNRTGNSLGIVGRLKPGVPLAAARAELTALGVTLTQAHPTDRKPGGSKCDVAAAARERQCAVGADDACLRGVRRHAHRVREPFESAAGARDDSPKGNGDSRGPSARDARVSCARCSPRASFCPRAVRCLVSCSRRLPRERSRERARSICR